MINVNTYDGEILTGPDGKIAANPACCCPSCATLPHNLNIALSGLSSSGCQLATFGLYFGCDPSALNALYTAVYSPYASGSIPPEAWTNYAFASSSMALYTESSCSGTQYDGALRTRATDFTAFNSFLFVTCSRPRLLTVTLSLGWYENTDPYTDGTGLSFIYVWSGSGYLGAPIPLTETSGQSGPLSAPTVTVTPP
jgi:hypothetical protein